MITRLLCITLWIAQSAVAVERGPMVPTTASPIVYTFGYTDEYFTDAQYLDRFKAAPPDLLQIGKAVPITHLWGAARILAGENQYTGSPDNSLNLKNIALLTPQELEQRIANIRTTLARYHAIGVREITPYIALSAMAGDHEKRLGFWHFYDRWADYEKWAGPRPTRDPSDWLAVDREGTFLPGTVGGSSPYYFRPLHRYTVCINHPDWSDWLQRLIRMIADVGYDGCFIDNCGPAPCYCRYCKEQFRQWLADNRGQDWVAQHTAGLDRAFALDSKQAPTELVRRWRVLRIAEQLGILRDVGRQVNPHFTIFPNSADQSRLAVGSRCDRLMFEDGAAPGVQCADATTAADEAAADLCVSHMPQLLFAQHMNARSIFLLNYKALDVTDNNKWLREAAVYYLNYKLEDSWDNIQELALAEMAAFSGGGGVASAGRPQATYRAFFKKHPALFSGWQATAPVAVLHAYWGFNPRSGQAIHDRLAGSQRPFVPLIDASLPNQATALAGYAAIYLESDAYEMAPDQLLALREYANRGKVVLANKGVTINGRPAIELLGADHVAVWDPKQPLMPSAAVAPSDGIRKNVRFAMYQQPDRLAIHAVNYNVCLKDPAKKVLDVEATPLRIPLPAGWAGAVATCFDPSSAPKTVPCVVVDGVVQLTMPDLHIYKIVQLERK